VEADKLAGVAINEPLENRSYLVRVEDRVIEANPRKEGRKAMRKEEVENRRKLTKSINTGARGFLLG
jgi:hypothetical protein